MTDDANRHPVEVLATMHAIRLALLLGTSRIVTPSTEYWLLEAKVDRVSAATCVRLNFAFGVAGVEIKISPNISTTSPLSVSCRGRIALLTAYSVGVDVKVTLPPPTGIRP
jgi:hypothetical protein